MASARKPHAPKGRVPSDQHRYHAFIGDLLDGTIAATALHEQRDGQGRIVRLEYDDPNGNGGGGGAARELAPVTGDPLGGSGVNFSGSAVMLRAATPAPTIPRPAARARRRR